DHADWDLGSGNWTISAWVMETKVTDDGEVFIAATDNAAGWQVRDKDNKFEFYDFTDGESFDSGFTVVIDTWYHIAVVRNGNTLYWYVDGVEEATQDCTGDSFPDNSDGLSIGRRGSDADKYIEGFMD
ncbi:unnamed protein product, partial [marine sediment metagenome]